MCLSVLQIRLDIVSWGQFDKIPKFGKVKLLDMVELNLVVELNVARYSWGWGGEELIFYSKQLTYPSSRGG